MLADLADFCLAEQDTHQPGDPYTSAYHAGMRRVFLRIGSHMHSDDADLRALVRDAVDVEDMES